MFVLHIYIYIYVYMIPLGRPYKFLEDVAEDVRFNWEFSADVDLIKDININ